MIPFPLVYYCPETIEEATLLYRQLRTDGMRPLYYGGGTEILTLARLNQVDAGSLIDLKGIPEMTQIIANDDTIGFGAGLTLIQIAQDDSWPLLTATVDRIADHTSRSKITLGGNLGSTLPYREACLPFLLADSWVEVASPNGVEKRPFTAVFEGQLSLAPGEFLLRLWVNRDETHHLFASWKMTRFDWIDYPLVTVAAIREGPHTKMALTGYGKAPMRLKTLDPIFSNSSQTAGERARIAVAQLAAAGIDDLHGSAAYRQFVLQNTLTDIIQQLEESSDARPNPN